MPIVDSFCSSSKHCALVCMCEDARAAFYLHSFGVWVSMGFQVHSDQPRSNTEQGQMETALWVMFLRVNRFVVLSLLIGGYQKRSLNANFHIIGFESISGALQHAFVSFPYNYDTFYNCYNFFEIHILILKFHM